jgi:hypothetical protein
MLNVRHHMPIAEFNPPQQLDGDACALRLDAG